MRKYYHRDNMGFYGIYSLWKDMLSDADDDFGVAILCLLMSPIQALLLIDLLALGLATPYTYLTSLDDKGNKHLRMLTRGLLFTFTLPSFIWALPKIIHTHVDDNNKVKNDDGLTSSDTGKYIVLARKMYRGKTHKSFINKEEADRLAYEPSSIEEYYEVREKIFDMGYRVHVTEEEKNGFIVDEYKSWPNLAVSDGILVGLTRNYGDIFKRVDRDSFLTTIRGDIKPLKNVKKHVIVSC